MSGLFLSLSSFENCGIFGRKKFYDYENGNISELMLQEGFASCDYTLPMNREECLKLPKAEKLAKEKNLRIWQHVPVVEETKKHEFPGTVLDESSKKEENSVRSYSEAIQHSPSLEERFARMEKFFSRYDNLKEEFGKMKNKLNHVYAIEQIKKGMRDNNLTKENMPDDIKAQYLKLKDNRNKIAHKLGKPEGN